MRQIQTKAEAKAYISAAKWCGVIFILVMVGWAVIARFGG